jgi:SP family general alpha glucoside:H+ symporter-like MFS transporter
MERAGELAECAVSRTDSETARCSTDRFSSNGARAGEVVGLIINGFVSERYGYRKTMIGALMSMTAFIFILFFAPNVQTLVIGEVFCGIPWGMFQTLTTQYASEVAPVHLRPILTTFVNM